MKLVALSTFTLLATSLSACALTASDDPADQSKWSDNMIANPSTEPGCFHAAYPSTTWESTACSKAPSRPFASFAKPQPQRQFTVGNGDDFALQDSGLISRASGTFIEAKNVTSETDTAAGGANVYSLQANSNFMSGTAACASAGSGCLSWTQFVYSSGEQAAFMQDWLIGFGDTCPNSNFESDGQGDCFANSNAVSVDTIPVTDLANLKVAGKAENGLNIMVFANGADVVSTNQSDSITNLSTAWNALEFNVIGDGDASEADFNTGAVVRVRIGVDDGTTNAPQCVANDGTTGETNNLNLGACQAFGGAEPSIEFTESD